MIDVALENLDPLIAVLCGFVALVWGADRFVVGAAAVARNLGVSPLVVGLTIVGFGTSAPEMLVSAMAAHTANPGLGVGNALGSNIANITLILGIAALVRPLTVHPAIQSRELPLLLLTMAAAAILTSDGNLSRLDGSLLLVGLVAMMGRVIRQGLRSRSTDTSTDKDTDSASEHTMQTARAVSWLLIGGIMLLGSSRLLVWGAVEVARSVGVSDMVIGLTVVAFGTSLPELAASVTAAVKNEHEIAVGNIVGSNMFNLLGVLGLPGVIAPGPLDSEMMWRDWPVMFGMTSLLWVGSWASKRHVGRIFGALLILTYFGYLAWLFCLKSGVS